MRAIGRPARRQVTSGKKELPFEQIQQRTVRTYLSPKKSVRPPAREVKRRAMEEEE